MKFAIPFAIALLPVMAFAAGSSSNTAPKPSNNTTVCSKGLVWDRYIKRCVLPGNLTIKSGSLSKDEILMEAVREFAYFGDLNHAQDALRAMDNQENDLVLTYWGFTERKKGNLDAGMAYYKRALAMNPNNILTRSYMGQGFVDAGKMELAQAQLDEINARGGAESWPAKSLAAAIKSGKTYSH